MLDIAIILLTLFIIVWLINRLIGNRKTNFEKYVKKLERDADKTRKEASEGNYPKWKE